MSDDLQATVADEPTEPAGLQLEWLDRAHGIASMMRDGRRSLLLVEGEGSDWVVTLHGRRIPVTVRSWRERVLAEAERAAAAHGGPIEIRAMLPGLVVAVSVRVGAQVSAGEPLLTIEAMKMQNEVHAPRDGTVATLSVGAGDTVATGALLIALE